MFAGLEDVLTYVSSLVFTPDDLAYLESLGTFHKEFLDYLAGFRFTGDIWAMDEGMPAFPGEPLVRVHASLMEAQLIESALLAILNFQTLIATKSARVRLAANGGSVIEFGLRRAQGIDGALSASRAAYIGGADATSNTLAGKHFGIPVRGTMAHSWIMVFETEREAFEKYADTYPDGAMLLIDTYDTLGSGIDNAIAVGKRMKAAGRRNFGVRLDSGDLEYLSKKVRQRLDEAGLKDARIVASNELDENIIHQLITRGAPIDIWGVGTNLVTAGGGPGSHRGIQDRRPREKRLLCPDHQGIQQSREGHEPRHQAGLAIHERRGKRPRGPDLPGRRDARSRHPLYVPPARPETTAASLSATTQGSRPF